MRDWIRILGVLISLTLMGGLDAQSSGGGPAGASPKRAPSVAAGPTLPAIPGFTGPQLGTTLTGPQMTITMPGMKRESLGSAIEIVLLMTLLSMAPAIVMTMTCFTRIIIVLSFLRRAMSMQDLPPTLVVSGFAIFMSIFIMKPVITDLKNDAYTPYVEGKLDFLTASEKASTRMKAFMGAQTRPADVALIQSLTGEPPLDTKMDAPFHVMVPAFILSEIKTAFQMGFVLFLPFVIIDLVISSILVSMGMFTLPPVVVSTPLKLLLFVMIDGWALVVGSLANSFVPST